MNANDHVGGRGLPLRSSAPSLSPVTIGSAVVLPADYATGTPRSCASCWPTSAPISARATSICNCSPGSTRRCSGSARWAGGSNANSPIWPRPSATAPPLSEAASRSGYAQILLEFAAAPRPTLIGVAMARSGRLSQRIERLLNDNSFPPGFCRARAGARCLPCFWCPSRYLPQRHWFACRPPGKRQQSPHRLRSACAGCLAGSSCDGAGAPRSGSRRRSLTRRSGAGAELLLLLLSTLRPPRRPFAADAVIPPDADLTRPFPRCPIGGPSEPFPPISVHVPAIDIHQPPVNVHVPAIHIHQPPLDVHVPAIDMHAPAIDLHVPSMDIHVPSLEAALMPWRAPVRIRLRQGDSRIGYSSEWRFLRASSRATSASTCRSPETFIRAKSTKRARWLTAISSGSLTTGNPTLSTIRHRGTDRGDV